MITVRALVTVMPMMPVMASEMMVLVEFIKTLSVFIWSLRCKGLLYMIVMSALGMLALGPRTHSQQISKCQSYTVKPFAVSLLMWWINTYALNYVMNFQPIVFHSFQCLKVPTCSETTLTGESWFHTSIPLGIWTWVPCDRKQTG